MPHIHILLSDFEPDQDILEKIALYYNQAYAYQKSDCDAALNKIRKSFEGILKSIITHLINTDENSNQWKKYHNNLRFTDELLSKLTDPPAIIPKGVILNMKHLRGYGNYGSHFYDNSITPDDLDTVLPSFRYVYNWFCRVIKNDKYTTIDNGISISQNSLYVSDSLPSYDKNESVNPWLELLPKIIEAANTYQNKEYEAEVSDFIVCDNHAFAFQIWLTILKGLKINSLSTDEIYKANRIMAAESFSELITDLVYLRSQSLSITNYLPILSATPADLVREATGMILSKWSEASINSDNFISVIAYTDIRNIFPLESRFAFEELLLQYLDLEEIEYMDDEDFFTSHDGYYSPYEVLTHLLSENTNPKIRINILAIISKQIYFNNDIDRLNQLLLDYEEYDLRDEFLHLYGIWAATTGDFKTAAKTRLQINSPETQQATLRSIIHYMAVYGNTDTAEQLCRKESRSEEEKRFNFDTFYHTLWENNHKDECIIFLHHNEKDDRMFYTAMVAIHLLESGKEAANEFISHFPIDEHNEIYSTIEKLADSAKEALPDLTSQSP